MKICHVCHTEFPTGLSCPACGAFVVDPVTDDEPAPGMGVDVPASGSLGGWVLPPDPGPEADGHSGDEHPGSDTTAGTEDDPWSLPLPAPAWEARAAGSAGPPLGAAAPSPASAWSSGPDATADDSWGQIPDPGESEDAAPRALPANPEPGTLGGWIMPGAAPEPPVSERRERDEPSRPPTPPRSSTAAAIGGATAGATAPAASVRPPGADTPGWPPSPPGVPPAAGPGSPAGAAVGSGSSTVRRPKAATLVVIGVVAAFALVSALVLLLQPSGSSKASDAVASDITGTCFVYNGARERVERTVPCTASHDGTVLAFVGDPSSCPDTTTAVLTGQTDSDGTHGVICVNETT